MTIDIAPSPTTAGLWCVTAHTEAGDCHDFFSSKEEAVAFAQSFYGGQLVAVQAIPATTDERCDYYGATERGCGCPDAEQRDGGSYLMEDGTRACKHRAHRIAQAKAATKQTQKACA